MAKFADASARSSVATPIIKLMPLQSHGYKTTYIILTTPSGTVHGAVGYIIVVPFT